MEINDDTVILVIENQQGQYFPKWYDTFGRFTAGDPAECVDDLYTNLVLCGHAEYCPYRADDTFDVTVVTPGNARNDPSWGEGDADQSYWASERTPPELRRVLSELGVPLERVRWPF